MKTISSLIFDICLVVGSITACKSLHMPIDGTPTFIQPVQLQGVIKGEYIESLEKWRKSNVSEYKITVDVFSSFLSPSCHMQTTLVVKDDTVINFREITTPQSVMLPDSKVISNPHCSDFERYTIKSMFELVDAAIKDKLPFGDRISDVSFDSIYGYITCLKIIGGESVLKVVVTNFSIK